MNKIAIFEYYKDKNARNIAHAVKNGNHKAIIIMAKELSSIIKDNDLFLIPIPNSSGIADYTLKIVKEIAKNTTNTRVLDILRSEPRMSLYDAKKKELDISFEFKLKKNINIPRNSILIDNVIGTGITMIKARKAIGMNLPVLAYSKDTSSLKYEKELLKNNFIEKEDIIEKAIEFYNSNNFKGKIKNIIAYGLRNPLVIEFKKSTGIDLTKKDLHQINLKINKNRIKRLR